jgi:co-chaperonin GroES (HSP10)
MKYFEPLNRHLWVELAEKEEDKKESSVLIPEDFKKEENPYAIVRVLDSAPDCTCIVPRGRQAVVERHMLKKIKVFEKEVHIIQENYLLGVIK